MENGKLKNCKACGGEVAKDARICPHCGKKLKSGYLVVIGILVFIVLIVAIASSGNESEPQKVESSVLTQSSETAPVQSKENKTVFYVGETAELKGVSATLVNVTESTGSRFNKPDDGNVFVFCEFEIVNGSKEEIDISPVLNFEAYCDDYACSYSFSASMASDKKGLSETAASGKKINGVIGYEVPADWRELEVVFTPDYWSEKAITFIANNG